MSGMSPAAACCASAVSAPDSVEVVGAPYPLEVVGVADGASGRRCLGRVAAASATASGREAHGHEKEDRAVDETSSAHGPILLLAP